METQKLIMIAGICIFTAAICRLFDNSSKEYGVAVKTAAAVAVMSAVIAAVMPAAEKIRSLYEKTGADSGYLTILFKCLGICYLTRLAADICTDSGEGTLAVQAEFAGKTAMLLTALPLFEKVAELSSELIR